MIIDEDTNEVVVPAEPDIEIPVMEEPSVEPEPVSPPAEVDTDDDRDPLTEDVPAYLEAQVETIQSTMGKLDSTMRTTTGIRTQVTNQVLRSIEQMHLDLDSRNTGTTEMQLRAVDSLRALLADAEKSALNHVAMKMRQKEGETAQNVAQIVAEALTKISMSGTIENERGTALVDEAAVDRELERRFGECGCAVIADTELRDDAYDFSKNGTAFEKEQPA